jgi:parallel beta-helix repeat protein
VTANGQTGISLTGSSANNSLVGNDVTANSGLGIWLYNSSSNVLSNNNVTNNSVGIYLVYSPNNTLSDNAMGENKHNFGVYGTDLNMFAQSIDTSNVVDGKPVYYFVNQSDMIISTENHAEVGYVGFVSCTNVTVKGLDLTNNIQGLLLAYTNESEIVGDNPANNSAGIYLWGSSNNTLSDNNLTNNDIGIATYYSDNNSIFHNSMNNPTQTDAQYSTNIWDDGYPSGGNRWSDHNGTDIYSGPYQNVTGSDGLGDSGYTIDANNIDHYPLMGTYISFNASPEQTVQTISNSTISSFAFNGTAISFNVTGQTGTIGFCRICIPTALMGNTYRVFVNNIEVTYTTLPFSNSTRKYLYFNYTHSTKEVLVIPESPPFLIMPLLLTTTLLALMTYKRKHLPRRTPT